MGLDADQTMKAMLSAAQGQLGEDWPQAKAALERVLADQKRALLDIAEARIAGEITTEDMESQLEDEKLALEAGLAMVQVRSRKAIENALNAALLALRNTVEAALL